MGEEGTAPALTGPGSHSFANNITQTITMLCKQIIIRKHMETFFKVDIGDEMKWFLLKFKA